MIDSGKIQLIRTRFEAQFLTQTETIAEIGIGLGSLTKHLLDYNKPLLLCEIDPLYSQLWKETFPQKKYRYQFFEGDALLSIPNFPKSPIFVFGNLPYYCSTEMLTSILKSIESLTGVMLILQWELGQRLLQTDSSLSIFTRFFGTFQKISKLSGGCFYPSPNVDSMLLQFTPDPTKRPTPKEIVVLETILKGFFWGKRKKIRTILQESPFLGNEQTTLSLETLNQASERLGILENRAEELSLEKWKHLVAECSKFS